MSKKLKLQQHVRTSDVDYEYDRTSGKLTALTPEGWENMQNHVLPFFIDEANKCTIFKPEAGEDALSQIKEEGFTVRVVGAVAKAA